MPTFEIQDRTKDGFFDPSGPKRQITVPDDLSPDETARILEDITRKEAFPDPAERERALGLKQLEREESVEAQLGAPLIREERGVPAEFDEPGARFDLARSNLISEKIAKLQEKFPDAEVKTFEDPLSGPSIALRLPGETGFMLLDSDQVTTLSDVTDALGAVVNLETLSTIIATIVTRGSGLIARTLGQVGGGTVGRSLDIGVEEGRGFERDPIDALVTDAATSGLMAGAGEMAFALPRRFARGVTPGEDLPAQEAVRQFTEATGRPPTPGLTSPAIRGAETQAVATSRVAEARRFEDLRLLRDDFQQRVNKVNFKEVGDQELRQFVDNVTGDTLSLIRLQSGVSPESAGAALRRGRTTFRKVASEEISRRYDRAFELGEDAVFDIRVAKERAAKMLEGIKGAGAEGQSVQLQKTNKELREALSTITDLDDRISTLGDDGANAFEQIKTLRTRFFDLKNATVDGKATNDNRLAGEIWDVLSNSMDSPVGGSSEFRLAFRRASSANRLFERVLDMTDLAMIARSNINRPGNLVDTLVQPGNAKTLRTLRRILPENEFQRFKDGMATKLLSEPEKINSFMNRFRGDPRALAEVFDDREVELFRTMGQQIERLNSGPIVKALENQTTLAKRVKDLATSKDIAGIEEFIQKRGGKDSNTGRALRSGFIQALVDGASETKKGVEVLDPKKAVDFIKRFDDNGGLQAIMTPQEVRFLKDRQAMLSFFDFQADVGASIQRQELVSAAGAPLSPQAVVDPRGAFKKFVAGTSGLAKNALIGRIFMSPAGRKLFAGLSSKAPPDLTTLRAVAAITAETTKDFREQNDRP